MRWTVISKMIVIESDRNAISLAWTQLQRAACLTSSRIYSQTKTICFDVQDHTSISILLQLYAFFEWKCLLLLFDYLIRSTDVSCKYYTKKKRSWLSSIKANYIERQPQQNYQGLKKMISCFFASSAAHSKGKGWNRDTSDIK